MNPNIRLVDLNGDIVSAWKEIILSEHPEIQIVQGNILKQRTDVWVTPTNSKGRMSGGVDAAIKNHFGSGIELAVQTRIQDEHGGLLPVGRAVVVHTGGELPRLLVATPSMLGENDDLRRTKNTALACAAAFQAIYSAHDMDADIQSITIPGLGSGTGQVAPHTCAKLMKIGYRLFIRKRYPNFDAMLAALNEELEAEGLGAVADAGQQPNWSMMEHAAATGVSTAEDPTISDSGLNTETDEDPSVYEALGETAVSVTSHHQKGGITAAKVNVPNPTFELAEDEVLTKATDDGSNGHPKSLEEEDYASTLKMGTPIF